MELTTPLDALSDCRGVGDILGRVGDKWTVQVVVALHEQPRRFSDIKRHVAGISQQMLTRTLRMLERDGLVARTVRTEASPPQVDYALTALGRSLAEPVRQLALWAIAHRDAIRDSQVRHDAGR